MLEWNLYPDIAAASSLQMALQGEFDRTGHSLEVLRSQSPGWRDVGAVVSVKDRSIDVVMGSQERVFTVQFWAHEVYVAHGGTSQLAAVAESIRLWLSGTQLERLNAACPFVEFDPWSEAYERGEGIEFRWQDYLTNPHQERQLTALHSFIAAAIHQPRLRALYPFTSMGTLGFRPTVHYTYSEGPRVRPIGDDRYLVLGPEQQEVGIADAAGSVELALTVLDAIAEQ
ncbi:DUF6193 family natural product biosynthesis protein [Nocardia tengchongensis]|uniref:DUF6193 family natural product biosynthesis protein n=1 Tax=Nocardia tengchongensis TaxID=2055889 RepID=UPI00367920D5